MGDFQRAGHMDVSNTVDLSDPVMVAAVVTRILATRYPGADLSPLAICFMIATGFTAAVIPVIAPAMYATTMHSMCSM
ncbi:MAG: hypothetical protein IPG06_18810 [Haliea sp.]|nr:hypothetical protein [Haliea sp.]